MNVLLTVSGDIPTEIEREAAAGIRPRPDYLVMAREFGADLLDYGAARRRTGRLGRGIERVAGARVMLAWACFLSRRSHQVIVTDGEQIGLPLALLLRFFSRRRPRHLMIVHLMSVSKKAVLWRAFGLHRCVDILFVYAEAQQRFLIDELRVPKERVVLTPFMVDTNFFAPDKVTARTRRMICSAGQEYRDYLTLCKAVDGLDVEVVIAAGSRWSKRPDLIRNYDVPSNVSICTLDSADLRQLYADSLFVVMPLFDVDFQAGVTTILEAMAMGKAVVCSATRGQTDVIVDGENGRYVPPSDPSSLRAVIQELLDKPSTLASFGATARADAERSFSVERYATDLAFHVRRTTAQQ